MAERQADVKTHIFAFLTLIVWLQLYYCPFPSCAIPVRLLLAEFEIFSFYLLLPFCSLQELLLGRPDAKCWRLNENLGGFALPSAKQGGRHGPNVVLFCFKT